MNTYGNKLKFTLFGQSHAEGIGVVIDGLRAGEIIDEEYIADIMAKRAPGSTTLGTKRAESDAVHFLSGVVDGKTVGTSVCAIIKNNDTHSKDYSDLKYKPRPSHADLPAMIKYKENYDIRGGGQFSGRLTAPICVAGAIALKILESRGIKIASHLYSIGDICDTPFSPVENETELLDRLANEAFAVIDSEKKSKMASLIEDTAKNLDSVGGVIECKITGLQPGEGDPMYSGMENVISNAMFGIPAVKGIEFGIGFEGSKMTGSQYNDCYYYDDNKEIKTYTNNAGGICGGMTTGMPVLFKVSMKPTPSISKIQNTVDLKDKCNTTLEIHGRHDPCVAVRANAVIRCAAAFAVLDMIY